MFGENKRFFEQSGRSMIEMLGVLAIVGILMAGGIAGYNSAMQSRKVNAFVQKVQYIAHETRFALKGKYQDLTNIDQLVDAEVISANDKVDPFGGNFVVKKSSILGDNYFVIIHDGTQIPVEACVKLLRTDWGSSDTFWGVGFSRASNSGAYAWSKKTYPITSPEAAISACNTGRTQVVFWFK